MTPTSPVIKGQEDREVIYAKDQPEYLPLPAIRTSDGLVITRWKLTWRERWQVLWGGSLWLELLTFNKPLQPIRLSTVPPVLEEESCE